MISCQYCEFKAPVLTTIRAHYAKVHPSEQPFQCKRCKKKYKHHGSLTRHLLSCTLTGNAPTPKETEPPAQLPPAETIDTGDPFLVWCATDPARPSANTAASIRRLIRSSTTLQNANFNDPDTLEASVFLFEDECFGRGVTLRVVANYVRQIKTWAYFKEETTDQVHPCSLEFLELRTAELSSIATRAAITDNALVLQDPYAMATIRNEIIGALEVQRHTVIDPFLVRAIRNGTAPRSRTMVTFGCDHLRPWIELVMRFANIPCRIQITKNLLLPTSKQTTYVSKLVRHANHFSRIIVHDKVKESFQPVMIPLDATISAYLELYLAFCRPQSTTEYVFTTKSGAQWRQASKDIKAYLENTLKIPVTRLDPTGRFVHGARHIVLAAYALQVGFNHEKLQNFATLLRHSLDTSLRFYNVFSQIWRSKLAVLDFSKALGLSIDTETQSSTVFAHATLGIPHALLRASAQQIKSGVKPDHIEYTVRDASTQTGVYKEAIPAQYTKQESMAQHPQSTKPKCKECGTKLSVHGPIGNSRHQGFGCYFLQCLTCNPSKRITKDARVYPLGVTPESISVSTRPRNMKSIEAYIAQSNQKQLQSI